MNGKLPLIDANSLIKILDKFGFKAIRQRGSHVFEASRRKVYSRAGSFQSRHRKRFAKEDSQRN